MCFIPPMFTPDALQPASTSYFYLLEWQRSVFSKWGPAVERTHNEGGREKDAENTFANLYWVICTLISFLFFTVQDKGRAPLRCF